MSTTFDIAAAEEYVDGYLAENALSGPIESQRAWLLIARLFDSLGATAEQKEWALKLMVAAESAQKWKGWDQGWEKGCEYGQEVTA